VERACRNRGRRCGVRRLGRPQGTTKVFPVVQATVSKSALNVKANGKLRPLTIELTRGIDYRPTPTHSADTVRYAVRVVSTKVPSCHKGATGTLAISTKPSVLLQVCGQTFLRGDAPRRIRFFP
jgi:hypothetical protein